MMTVSSRLGDYCVDFHDDLTFLRPLGGQGGTYPIIDERVWNLYQTELGAIFDRERVLLVPIAEEGKNLESVQRIYEFLLRNGVRRNSNLLALGGGILQDLVAFTASTLFRGISWTFIPTTLLAQADSCIGGKSSLNFNKHKNLLGTFWPPVRIHVCPRFLATLAEDDYFSGMGEVLKLHLIGGATHTAAFSDDAAELYRREPGVVRQTVERSLEIKKKFIESDEFDGGVRLLLNYGHCFGHALESTSQFRVPHGQAVVAGMMLANSVSLRRGLLPAEEGARLHSLLRQCLIKPPKPTELEPAGLTAAMGRDKKRTGTGLALILLKTNHNLVQVQDLTPGEVDFAVQSTIF